MYAHFTAQRCYFFLFDAILTCSGLVRTYCRCLGGDSLVKEVFLISVGVCLVK